MNRKAIFIIAIETVLIIGLFWALIFYSKDEYDSAKKNENDSVESISLVDNHHGLNVVILPINAQKNSGITTSVLQNGHATDLHESLGTVIALDGLVELRLRYFTAKSDADVIRANLTSKLTELRHLKTLNADDKNISDQAVLVAKTSINADQTRINALEATVSSLRDAMHQQWGGALTQIATNTRTVLLKPNEHLIQVLFPFDLPEPATGSRLQTSLANTNASIDAYYISPAPNTDTILQGKTYLYKASDPRLRIGTRLKVSLPDKIKLSKKNEAGVIVPSSAVVWYGGKTWVYLKQSHDTFVRKAINTENEVPNGWFVENGLSANSEVVTNGAQLLLSEEFKYQIKNENED